MYCCDDELVMLKQLYIAKTGIRGAFFSMLQLIIGVEPITQVSHVRNKNTNIRGRSLN